VEQEALKDAVHSLAVLNNHLAKRAPDLRELVDASAATFRAFASENQNISRTMQLLPGTLRQTTITLRKVQRFANILRPASVNLIPAVRKLPAANRALSSLARARTDEVRDDIRPFVRQVRPLVRELKTPAQRLARATPDLRTSFVVLNHLFNTLAYNQKGREGPGKADRQEGYLFWLAWLNHQAVTLFSSQDANGGYRPLFLTLSCATASQFVKDNIGAEFALNLSPILSSGALCGNTTP
jgi:phospholipid/cholesterol/gamma-HCH transport system substrate-binding protein